MTLPSVVITFLLRALANEPAVYAALPQGTDAMRLLRCFMAYCHGMQEVTVNFLNPRWCVCSTERQRKTKSTTTVTWIRSIGKLYAKRGHNCKTIACIASSTPVATN
ncbi:hypothetical protein ACFX11_030808 [Malus domestica]